MSIKEIINERIEKEIPFLRKVQFASQLKQDSNFISSRLLPYLFYSNTINEEARIIPVFLSEKEDMLRLPLFYALGIFKSYADHFLSDKNFQNQDLISKDINIQALDSDICKLKTIDYTSNDIVLKTGRGELKYYEFGDSERLRYKNSQTNYIKHLEKIFGEIEEYKKTIKIGNNPLKLIQEMDSQSFRSNNYFHGALYFTNNLKLLEFKDFTINNESFFNTIPTSKMEIEDGKINFTRMGDRRRKVGKQVNKIEEFLIFTHLNNYKGFFEIKKEKKWLDTLMFDFTEDLKNLENVLDTIRNQYQEPLKKNVIKNIFLLFSEKHLDAFYKIKQAGINTTQFLLKREMKKELLNNKDLLEPKVIQCSSNELNKKFKHCENILRKFCSRVHLINLVDSLLKPFFNIKKRYFSLYNKDELFEQITFFENSLSDIKSNFFPTSEFDDDFSVIYSLLEDLKNNLINRKIEKLKKYISDKNLRYCIISYNDEEEDKEFVKNFVENENIEFKNPKDIKYPFTFLKNYDTVFILNLTRELSYLISMNLFPNNVYLLLDSFEYKLYEKTKTYVSNISRENELFELLNIDYTPKKEEHISENVTNDIEDTREFNLESFVNSVLKTNQNIKLYNKTLREKETESIMLFFEDGTSLKVNENKYFFIHKENIQSLSECHVKAKNLTRGDIIFLFKRDSVEFEKLILEVAEEDYPEIKNLLNLDMKWRNKIKEYIEKEVFSIENFRSILNRKGYSIKSNQAIQTWLNNDVYQPRNLNSLINIISELGILTENEIDDVIKAIKAVKALKTRLPNELAKIQFAELNGLEYNSNFEFPELTEKIYQFMDIKTISLIIN
ncbi:MAG: hypothetical protein ACOC2U_00390 [bacterium]